MDIGKTIKKIRKRLGMTQVQLAEKSGIRQIHISLIESGKRKPSEETINNIGLAFGINGDAVLMYAMELENINPKHKESFQMIEKSMKTLIEEIIDSQIKENGTNKN